MNIYFIGHDYKYAVEQMLLTLYPEERPVYPAAPEEGDGVTISLRRGGKYAVAVCCLSIGGKGARTERRIALSRLTSAVETARLEQRIVKQSFYDAALALGREKPIWGGLTGVRPGKFLAGLMAHEGLTRAQAERALIRDFDVAPERASLCSAAELAAEKAASLLSLHDICLYIGIPFCPTRCAYCSFISVDAPSLLRHIPDYLDSLEREMAATAAAIREIGLRIVAVYVGGGTPTTLSAGELDRLLTCTKELFDLSACREFTVEAGRPDTVTPEKLAVLRAHGVGRVSINPQTMSDEVLTVIGRRHTAAQICEAMDMVHSVGDLAVNMDLIAGLPGDSPESFSVTMEKVLSMHPENITVHTLALKKGSRFLTEGTVLPSGAEVGEMLSIARNALVGAKFEPYYLYRQKFMSGSFENVGWTRPGYENLYNICIMEELCSILAVGAGGSTKLVGPGGRVERINPPKYPKEYGERIEEVCAAKKKIQGFYKDIQKGE